MLFNSYTFIFFFLPVTLCIYFILNNKRLILASKSWLVFASLFFYSWWNIIYLPLILISMLFNYAVGTILTTGHLVIKKKLVLIFGILLNLLLLGYFKYADFFISNVNYLTNFQIKLLHTALPLGISFFTFTQIAYLVDAYRGITKDYSLLNYSLFVTFFPHLLAGPIIHHKEMMPQFDRIRNKVINYKNFAGGIFLFALGLTKKVVIADTIAVWSNKGFDTVESVTFIEGWLTSLSYTFQIYYDFSGYTDMALGAALMFNIKLPINFNSPYKALNIQDFWRRWHITLSRFMRDYIYIPLDGNRLSEFRTLSNLMLTFLIGGLWHGAGWTFIYWGFLHGLCFIAFRIWKKLNIEMPDILAWFLTFNFVNITWIFFRAREWKDATKILKGMFGFGEIVLDYKFEKIFLLLNLNQYGISLGSWKTLNNFMVNFPLLLIAFFIAILAMNSNEMLIKLNPNIFFMLLLCIMFVLSVLCLNRYSEFIYFRF